MGELQERLKRLSDESLMILFWDFWIAWPESEDPMAGARVQSMILHVLESRGVKLQWIDVTER